MKKMETLTLMAIVAMMSLTMISCDDEHFGHYYFDLDEALDAYFETYGDFGTDDRTTASGLTTTVLTLQTATTAIF